MSETTLLNDEIAKRAHDDLRTYCREMAEDEGTVLESLGVKTPTAWGWLNCNSNIPAYFVTRLAQVTGCTTALEYMEREARQRGRYATAPHTNLFDQFVSVNKEASDVQTLFLEANSDGEIDSGEADRIIKELEESISVQKAAIDALKASKRKNTIPLRASSLREASE